MAPCEMQVRHTVLRSDRDYGRVGVSALAYRSRGRASRYVHRVSEADIRPIAPREMDCLHNALVGIPASVTLKQLDLDMIKRIEVRKAVPDRAGQ